MEKLLCKINLKPEDPNSWKVELQREKMINAARNVRESSGSALKSQTSVLWNYNILI